MTDFLIRHFIPKHAQIKEPSVRTQYGMLSGTVGIFMNFLLFAVKLAIGLSSGAISIVADAIHNLSDAASAIVTLLGFRLAARPADVEHPFGHGRIEYLTGLFIATVILLVGLELLHTSVDKILHPEDLSIQGVMILILIVSVFMQLWLGRFNHQIGLTIHSAAIEAASADSLNDCIATGVVLVSLAVNYFAGTNIDGIAGLLVAGFVLHSGWSAAKETIQPLLGQVPDPELVKGIEDMVLSWERICGVHDLVVHDYGPGRVFASLHAELPSDMDIMEAHELIDGLELRLYTKFHISVTIHMDPVVVHDPEINRLREAMEQIVHQLDDKLSMHDFRMTTTYHNGRNLIFDVVVPNDCRLTEREIRRRIQAGAKALHAEYHTVVRIDHLYC